MIHLQNIVLRDNQVSYITFYVNELVTDVNLTDVRKNQTTLLISQVFITSEYRPEFYYASKEEGS